MLQMCIMCWYSDILYDGQIFGGDTCKPLHGEQHGTRGRPSGLRPQSHGLDPRLGPARRRPLLRPRHFLMSRCPSAATRGLLPHFSLNKRPSIPASCPSSTMEQKTEGGEVEGGRGRGRREEAKKEIRCKNEHRGRVFFKCGVCTKLENIK